jgi:GTP-binding protein HflX
VLQADLILHVRDIADAATGSQRADVNAVLAELGVDAEGEPGRLLEVWNKADLLDAASLQSARNETRRAGAVLVSAATGLGLDALRAEIERRLNLKRETIEIALKPEEGSLSNWIYENCEVLARQALGEGMTSLRIRVAPEKRERLARLAGPARLRLAAD